MTNQEKQQRKALASTVSPQTDRTDKTKIFYPGLTEEEFNAVGQFSKKLDKAFSKIREDGGYSSKDMCDIFDPCISAPEIVSKICAEHGKDTRHVNRDTMVTMRRTVPLTYNKGRTRGGHPSPCSPGQ